MAAKGRKKLLFSAAGHLRFHLRHNGVPGMFLPVVSVQVTAPKIHKKEAKCSVEMAESGVVIESKKPPQCLLLLLKFRFTVV